MQSPFHVLCVAFFKSYKAVIIFPENYVFKDTSVIVFLGKFILLSTKPPHSYIDYLTVYLPQQPSLATMCRFSFGHDSYCFSYLFSLKSSISLYIYSRKQLLCLPASKRFNSIISTRGFHNYRIMFHQSYPSKHACWHHEKVKTLNISSSKVMQIDPMPAACQVHPAGTPMGQGQYYIYYRLERNISCCTENEQKFVKTHFWKKKEESCKEVKTDSSKNIPQFQAKQLIECEIFLVIKFSPIFSVEFISMLFFVLRSIFITLQKTSLIICVTLLVLIRRL